MNELLGANQGFVDREPLCAITIGMRVVNDGSWLALANCSLLILEHVCSAQVRAGVVLLEEDFTIAIEVVQDDLHGSFISAPRYGTAL